MGQHTHILKTAEADLVPDIAVASQFYDLIEIFRIGGYSPHTNYLFLGTLAISNVKPTLSLGFQATMSIAVCSASKRYPSLHASSYDILTEYN
jgi:hypothetical protein